MTVSDRLIKEVKEHIALMTPGEKMVTLAHGFFLEFFINDKDPVVRECAEKKLNERLHKVV